MVQTRSATYESRPAKKAGPTFISLPTEIRNTIYEMVLAAKNTIHISSDQAATQPTFSHAICCATKSDDRKAASFKAATTNTSVRSYANRHRRCQPRAQHHKSTELDSKFQFNILFTCKQIYNEAYLLPYACNTFTFDDTLTLSEFLIHLRKPQIKVIKSITLSGNVSNIPASTVTQLKYLRNLMVFMELDFKYDNATDFELLDGANGRGHQAREVWLAGLFTFERLPLEKVTCCFYSGRQTPDTAAALWQYNVQERPVLMPEFFNHISKLVEERLLQTWAGGKKKK